METATTELTRLLNLEAVDLSAGSCFMEIMDKTRGDVKKAIDLFGFKSAIQALGEDFYRDPTLNYSKSSYDRRRSECQSLGISL